MKLPRDISGEDLARLLEKLGYQVARQTGSHLRLTTTIPREHHVTIPCHEYLKLGTLNGILKDVAQHLKISKEELARRLWLGVV
ncbi:type II toxin-antitoxin system HicA family toxin [Desulfobacca acetoxidans]|uniref:YcfA family protein n=1 Tax=Desulfobacca acetoxidans (strain ATCC 700848 / DSM 11109 / ASRB2) TaxID=880072 RepID=F2NFG2_DESAR|nr:type II toxin-antitoxin system HicA family toxin [Desulfobacca acetoxidans]AEB10081.1 YcfA family protein [Desulfobacca acetoxidans DSM 11109]